MSSGSDLTQYLTDFVNNIKQVHIFKAFMDVQKFIVHM